MRIILATPLYPPEIEDLSVYVKDLAEQLKNQHQITILAYASQPEKISGVNIVVVNKRQPLVVRILRYTFKLFRMSRQADVIYAQNAVVAGLPAIIVQWLLGIPVVINFAEDEAWKRAIHSQATSKSLADFFNVPKGDIKGIKNSVFCLRSDDMSRKRDISSLLAKIKIRLIMALQGWVLRRASAIIAPSSVTAEIIVRVYRVPENKIVINYSAVEKLEILPFSAKLIPHQIFATGRLTDWSGMASIIRAVVVLRKDFMDVKLIITGDGPIKDRLKELARELDVSDEVVFLGRVSRAENWYLRQTSQVHAHNFSCEDLSQPILESFLAGIPVVAADTLSSREIFFDGQGGLLFELNNTKELAQKISLIFKDQVLGSKIIDQAKKILIEKFSWRIHIGALFNLWEFIRKK